MRTTISLTAMLLAAPVFAYGQGFAPAPGGLTNPVPPVVTGYPAPRGSRAPAMRLPKRLPDPLIPQSVSLSGPRFGFTILPAAMADSIADRLNRDEFSQTITQFGWQWESQVFTTKEGLTGVTEMILLGGGLEQGAILPSGTWLVGIRTRTGQELGVGPNLSMAGIGLVGGAGVNFRSGEVNFPINFALASGRGGLRMSVIAGFNWGH